MLTLYGLLDYYTHKKQQQQQQNKPANTVHFTTTNYHQ